MNLYKKLFGYFDIIISYICKLLFGNKYTDSHKHFVGSFLLFFIFSLTKYILFGIIVTMVIGFVKEKYIDKVESKKDIFFDFAGVFVAALLTIITRELFF